jgi:hypothetical protein
MAFPAGGVIGDSDTGTIEANVLYHSPRVLAASGSLSVCLRQGIPRQSSTAPAHGKPQSSLRRPRVSGSGRGAIARAENGVDEPGQDPRLNEGKLLRTPLELNLQVGRSTKQFDVVAR